MANVGCHRTTTNSDVENVTVIDIAHSAGWSFSLDQLFCSDNKRHSGNINIMSRWQ